MLSPQESKIQLELKIEPFEDKYLINDCNNIDKETIKAEKQVKFTIEGKTNDKDALIKYNFQNKILFNVEEALSARNNNKKKIIQLGRKRKDDKTKGEHNKFSDDNIRRKCKHLILDSFVEFINAKIKTMYNGNIGKSIFKKEFLTLNKDQKFDSSIENNKNFLNKTLGDIYSDTISKRFTNYLPQHNKNLIQNLINEEDENKKNYFKQIFDLTFLQCLEHFNGANINELLEGMKCFKDIQEKFNDDKEYKDVLFHYIINFKEIINSKKSRKPRIKKEISKN